MDSYPIGHAFHIDGIFRLASLTIVIGLIQVTSACSMVDYNYRHNQFADSARKERSLGTITFHYGDAKEEIYSVNVNRIRHGYAVNAPLYKEGTTSINFTTSRDKEFGNFAGIRSRWEF